MRQALPLRVNPRRGQLATEAASERDVDPPDVWASRVADLLREVLRTHGGCFDPSYISHRQMGRTAFEDRVYEQLNKLLRKHELKSFVEGHPEFAWKPKGEKGMLITWADAAAPSSASARDGGAPAAPIFGSGRDGAAPGDSANTSGGAPEPAPTSGSASSTFP